MARRRTSLIATLAATAVLLTALLLTVDVGQSGVLAPYYLPALVLTIIALLALLITIGLRLLKLIRQLRAGRPGAKLTRRLILLFVLLAVPPAVVIFGFALEFLQRAIDTRFDEETERALSNALRIAQSSLALRERRALSDLREIAVQIDGRSSAATIATLRASLSRIYARELVLFEPGGRVLAFANDDLSQLVPDLPSGLPVVQAMTHGAFADTEPDTDQSLKIRVVIELPPRTIAEPPRLLQAIFPFPTEAQKLVADVERQFEKQRNARYLRASLQTSFVLILSLVALLSILVAILLAFRIARTLVRPLSELALASDRIAAGDFGGRVDVPREDELGFLASRFNRMADDLSATNARLESSRVTAERDRDFLETVLGRLSSGVLNLAAEGTILMSNQAVAEILGREMARSSSLNELQDEARLKPFANLLLRRLQRRDRNWRSEVRLEGDPPRLIIARGTRFEGGQLVVIDDITDLAEAQRNAAWGEVARRLAHEVKNPLTPIQLSAERLRRRCYDALDAPDAEILDRSTRTIVAQVETLKEMVDAFGEYAKSPHLQIEPVRLGELIEELRPLYEATNLELVGELLHPEPAIAADPGRLRQIFHNLVRNSLEAAEGDPIQMRVEHVQIADGALVFRVVDTGPGVPASLRARLFEPYVSAKARGSGLGLAIVRKLCEEHGAKISLEDTATGASFRFEWRLARGKADPGCTMTKSHA